jgi:hypothetical protein
MVAYANSVLSLTYPAPAYLQLIAPGDTPARQLEIGKESDCGLVLLGVQEGVFLVPPRGPYTDGSVFEIVYKRVGGDPWHLAGALRAATQDSPPQTGDGIVYNASSMAPAHMETCVEQVIFGNRLTIGCVAGGEKKAGLETVAYMSRSFLWSGLHWIDAVNLRPIIGIIDADLLAGIYPLC